MKVLVNPQTDASQVWVVSLSEVVTEHPPVTVGLPTSPVLSPQETETSGGAETVQVGAGVEKSARTVVPGTTVTDLVVGWLEQAALLTVTV